MNNEKMLEEVKKSYFKCTKKQNWENLLILLGSMEADHEQIENLYKRIDKILDYVKECPSDKYLKSSKIIELLSGDLEDDK